MIRVFSLWQPWASLCVVPDPNQSGVRNPQPPKQYETRHFGPGLELPIDVAIHATKKYLPPVPGGRMAAAMQRCGINPVPRGAIVGVARIVEVIPTSYLLERWRGESGHADELDFGDYRYGRYAWRLEAAIQLPKPIPFKGRQAVLWPLPADVEAQIREQLG